MSETVVVNCRFEPYDMYVGRELNKKFHYGNPFTHLTYVSTPTIVKVADRNMAIHYYQRWLEGLSFTEHEPERRQWILDNLEQLRGKRLGCFCKPAPCHGDVLIRMLEMRTNERKT